MASELELAFETYWIQCGGKIEDLESEFKFHPDRKWRIDFAYPLKKIGIELEGGTWQTMKKDGTLSKSGHTTGVGYRDDCIKYNSGILMGWRIFRLTSDMLHNDPWSHLRPIIELIEEVDWKDQYK